MSDYLLQAVLLVYFILLAGSMSLAVRFYAEVIRLREELRRHTAENSND
jgi:hypothetical protein